MWMNSYARRLQGIGYAPLSDSNAVFGQFVEMLKANAVAYLIVGYYKSDFASPDVPFKQD